MSSRGAAPASPAPRATSRWRRALAWASALPAACILLASTAPWWPGQLCCHWTLHAAILLLPAVAVFGRWAPAGGGLLMLVALGCEPWIASAFSGRADDGAGTVSVVSANLARWSDDRGEAAAAALRDEPDLACLIEVTDDDERLWRGDPRWPHQVWSSTRPGIALLSKLPLPRADVVRRDGNTLIDADLAIDGTLVRLLVVHPISPTSPTRHRQRDLELGRLAQRLGDPASGPALVIGDLNCTPGDRAWSRLRAATGLTPPAGSLTATWPAWLGPAGIPIDHVLVRGLRARVHGPIWLRGSDHRGLSASVGGH